MKRLLKTVAILRFFLNNQGPDFATIKGFTCIQDHQYVVCINKDLPDGMDVFTYAHEIGHIVLKHHEDYNVDNLTDAEYRILDREADYFAANLLMPEEWIRNSIRMPLSIAEIGRLKCQFGVSWEAIKNRLAELDISSKIQTQEMFHRWSEAKNKNEAYYQQCSNYCTSIKPTKRRLISMDKFQFPDVDKNLRFLSCPACGNADFANHARFCKKCGTGLYNSCSNIRTMETRCGERNVPEALFCEYCGALTIMGRYIEDCQAELEYKKRRF